MVHLSERCYAPLRRHAYAASAISYRRTQVMNLLGGFLSRLLAPVLPRRRRPFPIVAPCWHNFRDERCHHSFNRHAYATSSRFLPVQLVDPTFGLPRGELLLALLSTRLRQLRSFPTDTPRWFISTEGPRYASLHRHVHATSGHLLPTHPGGASHRRALVTPACTSTPTPPRPPPTGAPRWCLSW